MEDHSPPSSKKSSVIGKLERADTPRMSPYLTRSRKSSTLTEENIAVHNDSPTRTSTRRVTRRMSQGSESGVVLTPMPQIAKRTRRSPSVASGDDPMATPKKKFSVAQENVVMEEDETVEENTVQPPIPNTNGPSIENAAADKENINTMVNGGVPEKVTILNKSQDSNETTPVIEKAKEPRVVLEQLIVKASEPTLNNSVSDVSNAIPVDISTAATESTVPIVPTAETADPSTAATKSPSNQESLNKSVVDAVNEPVEPVSTEIADSSPDNVQKSTSEESKKAEDNQEVSKTSLNLEDVSMTSITQLNDTVFDSPDKSNNLSASVIVIPDTPIAPKPAAGSDIVIKPGTPIAPNSAAGKDIVINPETPIAPKSAPGIDIVIIPDTPIAPKSATGNDIVIIPETLQKIPKPTTTDPSVPLTPKLVAKTSLDFTASPKTPLQVQQASFAKTPLPTTPQLIPKKSMDIATTPITPLQAVKSVVPVSPKSIQEDLAIPETPKLENQNVSTVTESEEEMLLRSPPPPSKTHPEITKPDGVVPKIDERSQKKSDDDSTTKSEATQSKSETTQNGIADERRWGGSVSRKSDGQPIDKFGMEELNTEVETPKTRSKPSKKKFIVLSDEDESCDEEESDEDNKSRNMFLDDEAMDSNGEASMDEEERKYLEENEIPEDGISLGSDSEHEESDASESNDSFIVSDSSLELLDGSGDDLDLDTGSSAKKNTSLNKSQRGNKILDTSDEELKSEEQPTKSKRRPDRSLSSIAKYAKVDVAVDESELANLDDEPRKLRTSKRLSGSQSLSKKDTKRLSLHPNVKLNSLESNEEEQSTANKNDSITIDDSSEEDVTEVLANLDAEPKTTIRSKRLSYSLSSSKTAIKRMSLHPSTKFDSDVELIPEVLKQTTSGSSPIVVDESSKETVSEELANLDDEPKKNKNSKRQSEVNSLSKKEMKRLSLHPNTKLSSSESKKSVPNENDEVLADVNCEKEVNEELANLDDQPKNTGNSKRLSQSASVAKTDMKRFSLHPNTKLNQFVVNNASESAAVNGVEEMDTDETSNLAKSAPSVSQLSKGQHDAMMLRCEELLQKANEAKRQAKLQNKAELETHKYQRTKEKKVAKMQEKREKEARELKKLELDEKRRQLKREKKSKIAEVTEQERAKAIEKALKFSESLKPHKVVHSSDVVRVALDQSTEEEIPHTPANSKKRKRAPKMLQILNGEPGEPAQKQKKRRVEDDVQLAAKPEGFKINSLPIQNNKPKKNDGRRGIQKTSAGSFNIEPLSSKKKASPFQVTTLQYNPSVKFSSLRDATINSNSNVRRESAAELLNRKRRQNKTRRN